VISLVLADVPNESGITARAMQHIVGATQHIVDFGESPRSLIRDNSPPMSASSAVAILTNFGATYRYFCTFGSRSRTSI
jgi:hypothetical protein